MLWPVHAWAARLQHNRTQAPLPPRLHTLHSVCSVDHSPYLISLHQGVGHTPCTRPRRPSHTVCIRPEVVGNIITYHIPCLGEGAKGHTAEQTAFHETATQTASQGHHQVVQVGDFKQCFSVKDNDPSPTPSHASLHLINPLPCTLTLPRSIPRAIASEQTSTSS